jgi:predicted RNA-binding Zn ribbon-like protein
MEVTSQRAYERTRGKPYAETFRCPGGALCLDFCNSGQGVRNARSVEWLADFADLMAWLEASGALSARQAGALRAAGKQSPASAQKLWTRAIALREALTRVLLARSAGRAPSRDDLAVIDAEYARTAQYARLAATPDGFAWTLDTESESLDAALRPLVESAVSLLTSPRLARVRRCGNETCYWLFIDETKNCSRRWCEMASCGNRMKVRRHRARQRDA